MATIKSYTDLEQSKKLVEILALESADMFFDRYGDPYFINIFVTHEHIKNDKYQHLIPCWSLAALLDVLSKSAYFINEAGIAELSSVWRVSILNCGKIKDCYADNPVDACYEMVIRLNELKML